MPSLSPSRFRRAVPILLFAGVIAGAALPAFAADEPDAPPPGERAPHGEHGPHGGPFLHALKQLDLSDSQRETIKRDLQAFRDQQRANFESMRSTRRAFDTATPDSAGYGTVVAQLADAAASGARDHVQKEAALRAQVYAVLTDAQKSKLASVLASLPEPPARR